MELAEKSGYTRGAISGAASKLQLTYRREWADRYGTVWEFKRPLPKPCPDDRPGHYIKTPGPMPPEYDSVDGLAQRAAVERIRRRLLNAIESEQGHVDYQRREKLKKAKELAPIN